MVHGSYAVAAAIDKRVRVTVSEENNGKSNTSSIWSNGDSAKLEEGGDGNDQKFQTVREVSKSFFQEYGSPKEPIRVEINSEIPEGSGLGSSAAVSVAVAGALSKFFELQLTNEEIARLSAEGEKKVHGSPSGIDTAASLLGGVILYRKGEVVEEITINQALHILVVFTGSKRSTADLISRVANRKQAYPATFEALCEAASLASLQFAGALKSRDLSYLGALMSLAQTSLSWIGCSTRELDDLIEQTLKDKCSFGAKLTGAGGGGSVIALPQPEKSEQLLSKVSEKYPFSFIARIPQKGLLWK